MNEEYYKNVKEIWKDITGYIGLYMVSNYGNVKRLIGYRCVRERIIKPWKDKKGYLYVDLCKNCTINRFIVHRLVLETFVGFCPEGKEVCHNDGDSSNNFVENLRYDTHKNNVRDAIKHGTFYTGDKKGIGNGRAKLNDNKIRKIRKLHSEGITQKELSAMFRVGTGAICSIVNYKTWKHVK